MNTSALRRRVADQIVTGTLPREPARALAAGYGDGSSCDVCGEAMQAPTVTYAMRLGTGTGARSASMHSSCFELWEEIRKLPPSEIACEPQ